MIKILQQDIRIDCPDFIQVPFTKKKLLLRRTIFSHSVIFRLVQKTSKPEPRDIEISLFLVNKRQEIVHVLIDQ